MKINVASTNIQKIQAVKDIASLYEIFKNSEIEGVSVSSGVSDQPWTLEATIDGAINRAKNAFIDCDYSVGIESGLVGVPKTKSGFVDVCVCAIYDGKEVYVGLSTTFEIPKRALDLIDETTDLSSAWRKAGLTNEEKIGTGNGVVGMLTKNRITRLEQTRQALISAMVRLDNKELF